MRKRILLFTGLWLLGAFLFLAWPKTVFSEAENRYLQQKPALTGKRFKEGTFGEEWERFLSDQFPLREPFVKAYTRIRRFMGCREIRQIYLGAEDHLPEAFQSLDEALWQENLENAAAFLDQAEKEGVHAHLLLAPTAAAVQPQYLPADAPELDQKKLLDEAEEHVQGLIRVEGALQQHSGEDIYYHTDHHWTSLGAYYAYAACADRLGIPLDEKEAYVQELLGASFYGSSCARAGFYEVKPDAIYAMYRPEQLEGLTVEYSGSGRETTLYDLSFLEKRDQYRVFLKGNEPLTVIRTGTENGRKLLLIKDSYANTFVQFLLGGYEEIHLLDPRYYRDSPARYGKEQQMTDVLILYQIKNFTKERIVLK